jgi:protein TonB
MATFDQPSDLIHRIAYPALERPGSRIDSRVAATAAKKEKQLPVPFSRPGIEDSLFREIEPGAKLQRNPWAAVGSPALLLLVSLMLIVVPLYHTDPLPKREVVTMLYLQPPPAAGSSATRFRAPTSTFTPTKASISTPVFKTPETTLTAPPAEGGTNSGVAGGVPGGVVGGIPDGVLSEVMGSARGVAVLAKAPDPMPVKRVRVPARIAEANLIHDVAPTYPAEAGRARIEGTVVLMAVIGEDGTVKDVRVESGLPILAQAAIDAVKRWRYKPYTLNGEPVEVDSRITINFTLS